MWDDEINRCYYIIEVVVEEIYFVELKFKDVLVDSEVEVKEDIILFDLDEEIIDDSEFEKFFEEDVKILLKNNDVDEGIEDDLLFQIKWKFKKKEGKGLNNN